MSVLTKFKLSQKTRSQSLISPEARVRLKMINAIHDQIGAAEAEANGQFHTKPGMRYVQDHESGERVKREVPIRIKPWWFKDESGKLFLEVRYGNKRVPLKNGQTAIEVGEAENLVPTLKLLTEAVTNGELDKPLLEIRGERAARFQSNVPRNRSKQG